MTPSSTAVLVNLLKQIGIVCGGLLALWALLSGVWGHAVQPLRADIQTEREARIYNDSLLYREVRSINANTDQSKRYLRSIDRLLAKRLK